MKHNPVINIVFISALVYLVLGCSKDNTFDCFKSTGEIMLESREVPFYHTIEVHDNINLFLTQDSLVSSLEVEAGENLLPGIMTEVNDDILFISNDNRCNWVRPFDVPINVYITFTKLDSVDFHAAGDLTFNNPWKNDSIQFDVWEGAGVIDLKLDVSKSKVYVHYGVTSLNLSGESVVSYISNKGYGPVDALNLNTEFTFMSTSSPNDCFVMVHNELGVTINNIGNVYYKGNPGIINQSLSSSGKLIRLE
jgi:hypothetical protein